jgi:hypothetical protein
LIKIMHQYRRGAKVRNLSFELSQGEFFKMVKQNCHYCGIEPSRQTQQYAYKIDQGKDRLVVNGIDRINSDYGYTKTNTVPCCQICNRAKSNMKYEDFQNWISKLKNR